MATIQEGVTWTPSFPPLCTPLSRDHESINKDVLPEFHWFVKLLSRNIGYASLPEETQIERKREREKKRELIFPLRPNSTQVKMMFYVKT